MDQQLARFLAQTMQRGVPQLLQVRRVCTLHFPHAAIPCFAMATLAIQLEEAVGRHQLTALGTSCSYWSSP